MAANDYYNTSYTPQHGRTNDTLPPLPSTQSQNSVSPFDDHNYYNTPNSSGALGGYPSHNNLSHTNTSYGGQQDPFTDSNAIPLSVQPKMHGPEQGKYGDESPTRYNADPEAFAERPRRKRSSKKKKKEGWFSGRITWVVYILTTVQVGVFVGELIKNGTSPQVPFLQLVSSQRFHGIMNVWIQS
jgi:hypothetical protein